MPRRIQTLIALCLLTGGMACSPSIADRPAPERSSTEIATGSDEPAGEEPPNQAPQPGEAAPAEPPAGRLAFTQCDPEKRPQVCTKEYRPVCGEVDNGVRCITTPCASTDQKEFSNGCTACSDAKATGYWPVPCAQLTTNAP